MRFLATTQKGIEFSAAEEIKEIIDCPEPEIRPSCVLFETENPNSIISLIYKSQSITKCFILLGEYANQEDLLQDIPNIKISELAQDIDSQRVEVHKLYETDQNRLDIQKAVGEEIYKQVPAKVDFDNPDVTYSVCLSEAKWYFGIDVSYTDLSKRSYKVFPGSQPLKATVAYTALRTAGFTKEKLLLDPFCGPGIIAIEATLLALNFSVRFYDKQKIHFPKIKFFAESNPEEIFEEEDKKTRKEKIKVFAFDTKINNINAIKKNATIAGINKSINFSRTDVDWIDIKFEKQQVDMIVSYVPSFNVHTNTNFIDKIYNQLFHRAADILAPNGNLTLISRRPILVKEAAERNNYTVDKELFVMQGKEQISILKLKKSVG